MYVEKFYSTILPSKQLRDAVSLFISFTEDPKRNVAKCVLFTKLRDFKTLFNENRIVKRESLYGTGVSFLYLGPLYCLITFDPIDV